jgi:hypothetical protein
MMIRVMVKEPFEAPYETEIENELEEYKRIVGGHIECVPLADIPGTVLICNDEGKLQGLAPNLFLNMDVICGTVIAAGVSGEEFADLPKSAALKVWLRLTIRALHRPEETDRATGFADTP